MMLCVVLVFVFQHGVEYIVLVLVWLLKVLLLYAGTKIQKVVPGQKTRKKLPQIKYAYERQQLIK